MKGFKDFIFRGNIVDLAIAVIVGNAFGQIVNSLVKDIIMPPINILLSGVNFANWFIVLKSGQSKIPYSNLDAATKDGAITLNLGTFINTLSNFIIIAICVYLMLLAITKLRQNFITKNEEVAKATTKQCNYCCSSININATKCPSCTANLN